MSGPVVFGDYLETRIVRRKLIDEEGVKELGSGSGLLKVLAVGSYDILTPGHKNTLYFSKNPDELLRFFCKRYPELPKYEGRLEPGKVILLVAMNSDRSFRRWDEFYQKKGKRKIATHDENERVWQLANEESVDYIVLFDGMNAGNIILGFRPDLYAKGGDYVADPGDATKERPAIDQEERRLVEKNGGNVVLMPAAKSRDRELYHSYNLIRRILGNHGVNNA